MIKEQKKREHKITAQCLGIVLLVFAFGLFIGYTSNYQDIVANLFANEVDSVHVIHNSSEATEHGAKISFYTLGTTKNTDYTIEFNNKPKQEINHFYTIEGKFTNNTDKHFTTVELNFSLLDKEGNKVGDVHGYCDGLNSGQTWKFVADNSKAFKTDTPVISAILDDVIYTML